MRSNAADIGVPASRNSHPTDHIPSQNVALALQQSGFVLAQTLSWLFAPELPYLKVMTYRSPGRTAVKLGFDSAVKATRAMSAPAGEQANPLIIQCIAGEHAGAGGDTNGVHAVSALEAGSVLGETVHRRSFDALSPAQKWVFAQPD